MYILPDHYTHELLEDGRLRLVLKMDAGRTTQTHSDKECDVVKELDGDWVHANRMRLSDFVRNERDAVSVSFHQTSDQCIVNLCFFGYDAETMEEFSKNIFTTAGFTNLTTLSHPLGLGFNTVVELLKNTDRIVLCPDATEVVIDDATLNRTLFDEFTSILDNVRPQPVANKLTTFWSPVGYHVLLGLAILFRRDVLLVLPHNKFGRTRELLRSKLDRHRLRDVAENLFSFIELGVDGKLTDAQTEAYMSWVRGSSACDIESATFNTHVSQYPGSRYTPSDEDVRTASGRAG